MSLNPFPNLRPSLWPGGFFPALSTGVPPLVFDASVREEHGQQWAIASSPIEGGATISDHVQLQPEALTVDVALSDNPDSFAATPRNRHKDLYAQILAVAATREPFDFITTLAAYHSMVFTSISAPRSAETGNALICTLVIRRIEIATVDQAAVLADAALAVALGTQNLGSISPDVTQALDALQAPVVI